jgi:hypothetical protein
MRPNESPIPIIEELTWRGPWSAVAAYELGDAVVYQGSTWLAVAPSVNVAPPTLPTESNASWHLMAKLGNTGPAGAQGPQGNIGPAGPQGNVGPAGPQGDDGPQGPAGGVGPQGPAGTPGEAWFSGSGAPAGGTGIVGDWYLNADNGDVYEKTGASAWTLRGNIRGPQGDQGIQGVPGNDGADGDDGAPGAPGADGDDGIGMPVGGATDTVAKKNSATDHDIGWAKIVNANVDAAAAIAESKLNLASDAAAGTASRRTLGTGASQAAAGDHTHARQASTGAKVYRATNQTIVNGGTPDPVSYSNELWDDGNLHWTSGSPTQLVAGYAGRKRLRAFIDWTGVADATNRSHRIRKNGITIAYFSNKNVNDAAQALSQYLEVTDIAAASTDVYTVEPSNTRAGSGVPISGGPAFCWFEIENLD